MKRRDLLIASSALAAVQGASAQPSTPATVAFFAGGKASDSEGPLKAFVEGLQSAGYRPGVNLTIDAQYAEYSRERGERLAAEMAARKPAVIVASGAVIAQACRAVPVTPVIFVHSGDPVEAGFVESIVKPGRNATGISLLALDLIAKRLEFLKELKPGLRRVAFLASPEHAGHRRELAASRSAAWNRVVS